jgi:hypothetical protein
VAERLEQRELPVPRERDLRAGIATCVDLAPNEFAQLCKRTLVQTEVRGAGCLENEGGGGHGLGLPFVGRSDALS